MTPDGAALPLRVDTDLRQRLRQDPTAGRAIELARLLVAHGLGAASLAVLRETGAADLRVELAACRLLPPPSRREAWRTLAAQAREDGDPRDAFDLFLLDADVAGALRVAERTPGALGEQLGAELNLRLGRTCSVAGLGPLFEARVAWLRGAMAAVPRLAEQSFEGDPVEARLLSAAALRRLGRRREARSLLDEARARSKTPLPGAELEALLLHLSRPRLLVREPELMSPARWAVGGHVPNDVWWPTLRRWRHRLGRLDDELGPFRGEILTRYVGDRVAPCEGADDPRFRAAALRMGLRVTSLDEALALADELDRHHGHSALVPMYVAEILHWHGAYEKAGRSCEEAIRRDPRCRWAWIGLAQARMWTGDLLGAERAVGTLVRRLPQLPTLPAVRGEIALLAGRHEAAVPHLRRAVALHPTRRSAWVLLAVALDRCGDSDAAAEIAGSLRRAAPDAWWGDGTRDALERQLGALRGNRSSSFVTLFPTEGETLLLQGAALLPTPRRA